MTNRLAYVALAIVCFFWGTTYLGIRVSLEGIAPFYLIAIRYVISGGVLLLAAALAGMKLPQGRELGRTSVCGIVCITIGNGALVFAELYIPTGLAALFYTTAPFWMVGVDALLPHGTKPLATTLGGLLVGVLGVAFLVYPAAVHEGFGGRTLPGFLILQLSVAAWVTGALLQKRIATQSPPLVTGAVQQFAAGLAAFVLAALFEKAPHHLAMRPAIALIYLISIGSIVGYTAFIYAMARLPVAVVSIYMFVNPVVAVFLGYLFFREPFGYRAALAMLIIFAGIAFVRWSETAGRANGLWGRPADC
jgi:drug/metabolite transporter (DMT)-like permease